MKNIDNADIGRKTLESVELVYNPKKDSIMHEARGSKIY